MGQFSAKLTKFDYFLHCVMKENANKLHFKCTDFNSSMHVIVYAECIYVLIDYLKF